MRQTPPPAPPGRRDVRAPSPRAAEPTGGPRGRPDRLLASLFVALVGAVLVSVAPAQAAAQDLWHQRRPPQSKECSQMCKNAPYDPVCGNDMKTYPNECRIRHLRLCRKQARLEIYHKGMCTNSRRHRRKTCLRRRMEMLRQVDRFHSRPGTSSSYIPVCREDGTFKKIQCQAAQNICFCVDRRSGLERPGTAVRPPQRPKCGESRKPGRVDKCSPKLRKQFNDNLIRQFKIEFDRVVRRRQRQRVSNPVKRNTVVYPVGMLITGERGYTLNSTELRVVEWKFSELDLNHDNMLSFRELRSLRRVVRRVVRPRACARRFAKRCDTNKNRRIERTEWSVCMGINTASFNEYSNQKAKPNDQQSSPASIIGLVTRKRTDKPSRRPQPCNDARREAEQKKSEDPMSKVFVLQCTPDGRYKRQQCHHISSGEKLCFCMDPNTGDVVKGASDCLHMKPTRKFKGCPNSRKKRFLTELMDRMVEETKSRWGSRNGPTMPAKTSLEERALRWKFFLLDANRNGRLDKKEMRRLKEQIKHNIQSGKRQVARELRKCARNFVRYCDANGDRNISLDELIQCTDIRKKTTSRPSAMTFPLILTS